MIYCLARTAWVGILVGAWVVEGVLRMGAFVVVEGILVGGCVDVVIRIGIPIVVEGLLVGG